MRPGEVYTKTTETIIRVEVLDQDAQGDLMNDGRSLTHKHRVVPGHKGGEYKDENVIEVHAIQCNGSTASHCMWHWANFFLWGDIKDKKAAEGLAGFKDREQIIIEMISEGGKKGGSIRGKQISSMSPEQKKEATKKANKVCRGSHWWYNPNTGKHKRSKESPGPDFVLGRNQYTDEWVKKLGESNKGKSRKEPRVISLVDGMITNNGNITRHHTCINCSNGGRMKLTQEQNDILEPLTNLERLVYIACL
jgi:hypothetical protein